MSGVMSWEGVRGVMSRGGLIGVMSRGVRGVMSRVEG